MRKKSLKSRIAVLLLLVVVMTSFFVVLTPQGARAGPNGKTKGEEDQEAYQKAWQEAAGLHPRTLGAPEVDPVPVQHHEKAKKYSIVGKILVESSKLLKKVAKIKPFDNILVSNSTGIGLAIKNGNKFILNLANLGFIFILLWIALATIFGIERYSAGKLLPRLTIIILLANFGLYAVVLVSNFAQLLTIGLMGNESLVQPILNVLKQQGLLKRIISAFFTIITLPWSLFLDPLFWLALVILAAAIILLARLAILWALAILAPIGIVLFVLPASEKYAKQYWKKVIGYAFVGPTMIFFIRLAVIVWQAVENASDFAASFKIFGVAYKRFIQMMLMSIIIIIGWKFSKKMIDELATFLQKAAKATAGAAIAVGLGVATGGASLALGGAAGGLTGMLGKGISGVVGGLAKTEAGRARARRFLRAGATGLRAAGKKGGWADTLGKSLENGARKMEAAPRVKKEEAAESPEAAAEENKAVVEDRNDRANNPDMRDRMQDIAEEADPNEKMSKIGEVMEQARQESADNGGDEEQQATAAAGMALLLASEGILSSTEALKTASRGLNNAAHEQLIAAEAARNSNMTLATDVTRTDNEGNVVYDNNALADLVKNNTVDTQSPEALKDYHLARAIYQADKGTERQRNAWSEEQNQRNGEGLVKWLNVAGTADSARRHNINKMSDEEYRGAAQQAAFSGTNISEIFGKNGGRRAINAQVKEQIALNPRSYDRQDKNGAVELAKALSSQQLARLMPQLKTHQKNMIVNAAKANQLGQERDLVILSNPLLNVKQPNQDVM